MNTKTLNELSGTIGGASVGAATAAAVTVAAGTVAPGVGAIIGGLIGALAWKILAAHQSTKRDEGAAESSDD
jgi:hypothetical protein